MQKRKFIPIILFLLLTIIGLALFLEFKTPHEVLTFWISDYEEQNSFAPSIEYYQYAIENIGKTNRGYYTGIIFCVLGAIGTIVCMIIFFLSNQNIKNGYCDILKHVLLLLFTFGIYYLIWIYHTTEYLNQVEDAPSRNPTTKLLLCIFVPFYLIYWIYKSAQQLDKLATSKGVESNLVTICSVLAIFINIIPPIIMQNKINTIANVMNKT